MASEYEYRTESLPSLRDSKRLSKMITRLGKRGWEMVDKQEGGLIFGRARVTFRRPKSGADVSPVVAAPTRGQPVSVGLSPEEVMAGLTEAQVVQIEELKARLIVGGLSQSEYDDAVVRVLKPRSKFWQ